MKELRSLVGFSVIVSHSSDPFFPSLSQGTLILTVARNVLLSI